MVMKFNAISLSALGVVVYFSFNVIAAAQQSQQFLPPGKWTSGRSSEYFCVPQKNSIPQPKLIATEFASNFSTGDARWIGICKAQAYKVSSGKAFSVKLECSQTRVENNSTYKFKPAYIAGHLLSDGTYVVEQKTAIYSDTYSMEKVMYKRISATCSKAHGYTILSETNRDIVGGNLNPDLQFLIGFPAGTAYYSTSKKYK